MLRHDGASQTQEQNTWHVSADPHIVNIDIFAPCHEACTNPCVQVPGRVTDVCACRHACMVTLTWPGDGA